MPDDPPLSMDDGRRNPATGVHLTLDSPVIVLLTVNTLDRNPWLAHQEPHRLLHEVWLEATAWLVSDYVLMPDHLHCFCAPRDLSFSIERWISFWKTTFRWKHGRKEWKFQSRGWHHRLRDGESYSQKWIYMRENPVRKGLVTLPDDWPYQGRVHDVRW